jgi:ubiquinone/menaquinone biosynthesis C-methylase UbiE
MLTPEDAKVRAAATYDAASDSYDHPANSFWNRYGRRTVERLQLQPGARILDVCCGSGASAIPAAETVGASGHVLGIDLAENLLALARRKAEQRGLGHVDFRIGDMLDLRLAESGFDAVICVFGIFFVPDVPAAVRELWRFVRPGGKLAITTWGPRFLEPGNTAFWNSVRGVRPDLYKGFNPWDRITEPNALRAVFSAAGVNDVDVVAESGVAHLLSPEDWWAMVLGTGYRGTLEQLDGDARDQVRRENVSFIRQADVTAVETNVVYAVAARA